MLLRKNAHLSGILLNSGNIVFLLCFLDVILEIAPAATCPTSYGCDTFCHNDTYGCYDCPPYYGLSNPTSPPPYRCSSCGVECLRCRQGLNCTQCRTGYGPNGSWNCSACLTENCYSCPVNVITCMNCKPGYGFYPNKTTCGACSAHCTDYGCDKQFPGKCDKCDFGYGFTPTNSCEACSEHCEAGCYITGAGRCDRCDFGYGLTTNGSCGVCSAHCAAGCNETGAGKCDQCDPGYGLSLSGSCGPCSPNCAAGCKVSGECTKCDSGFGLTMNRSCAACSSNCSAGCNSTGAGKCDQCDPGTGKLPNGSCATCSAFCAAGCNLTGAGKCDSCNLGYESSADGSCTLTTTVKPTTTVTPKTTLTPNILAETTVISIGISSSESTTLATRGETESPVLRDSDVVVLTLILLILGGIIISFMAVLCWCLRFYQGTKPQGIRRTKKKL